MIYIAKFNSVQDHQVYSPFDNFWNDAEDFVETLAEIVDVRAGGAGVYDGTNIHVATICPFEGILEILLKRSDADPNFKNYRGQTALHQAAFSNKTYPIETLLKHGAKVDETDNDLETPMMIAVKYNNTDTVKALLSHHANPNLKNVREKTALQIAARRHSMDIAELLLYYGAEIDETDEHLKKLLQGLEMRDTIKRKRNCITEKDF